MQSILPADGLISFFFFPGWFEVQDNKNPNVYVSGEFNILTCVVSAGSFTTNKSSLHYANMHGYFGKC